MSESEQNSDNNPAVHRMVLMPLDEPIAIDAIKCRLRQDVENLHHLCSEVAVPKKEALWISDVLDAVRACVREWEPSETEKARGAGTGVGMRAVEDRLILIARRDPYRS